jgi:hypothetical protein
LENEHGKVLGSEQGKALGNEQGKALGSVFNYRQRNELDLGHY